MKIIKHQHSSSRETSMTNIQTASLGGGVSMTNHAPTADWSLKLGISLKLEVWNLEFI
ncbi:MAG: hypothetical protein WDM80_17375 [Limisphaerales bacterium]